MTDNEFAIRQRLKDDFVHYASRCLQIRTKAGNVEPFILNKAQLHVHHAAEDQLRRTGKVRKIVLKGRQQGLSTLIEGRYYWRVTHRRGIRAFILTHEVEATNNLFEMAQRYHQYCPELVRPQTDASNAKELNFGVLDSGYKVGTAGNKSVGRSSTVQLFHGCLAEGTFIYDIRSGGIKRIEDFKINDPVLTHTGHIALISFISKQEKECLSVKFRGLTAFPLVATKEHRFWTKSGWKELHELSVGDSIGYPIKEINNELVRQYLPPAPIRKQGGGRQGIYPDTIKVDYNYGRLVGLYLAEGHIKLQSKSHNYPVAISFAIHRKEVDRTVEWLEPFNKYYSKMHIIHRPNSLTSVVTIYGNRLAALINETFGRVREKHIHYSWHKMGEDFCRGLLHGYISGDGSSYGTDRRVRVSSICSPIIITLRDIAASLGYGWAGIEKKEAGLRCGRNEKERFTFSLCGDGASRLAKEIGKPTPKIKNVKTKSMANNAAATTEISNGYAWIRIRSIENVGIKKVYDFEVDHEDHSYCTIHGASHNSEVAFWPNAAEHAKGIMQAIPNEKDTEVFLESTANGVGNYFHEQWQLAEAGESEYEPIFLPWYWQNEYERDVPPDFKFTDEEEELARHYSLTPKKLVWRRIKIRELSANGMDGYKAFKQEYPCTAAEAFQTSGEDGFIKPEIVMRARKCNVDGSGALVIGVDPARFGDDRTSIIRRRTRKCYNLQSYAKRDTMEVAGIVHKIIKDEEPAKVFIDVGGLGAGVVDRLRELGYKDIIVPVNGGEKPLDADKYINKRAEMWGEMKLAMEEQPFEIPDLDSLHADLCGVTYRFDSKTRLILEKKEDMKRRGLRSPDEADALALTFAHPVIETESKRKASVRKSGSFMTL